MTDDHKTPEKTSILKQRGGIWSFVGLALVVGIIAVLVIQLTGPGDDETESPPPYEPPRHLILISIDTLRADHLGCFGHETNTSPVIDSLADGGALFERHYSCYPLTLPAHLTQLTGVSTLGHRVRDNLYHTLPTELATLPEVMREQGFNTGAFVSAHTMRSGSGMERGFDVYDDDGVRELEPGALTIRERKADETLQRAGEWIATQGGDRFFCFIHLFDPHAPYEPHSDLGDKFQGDDVARYDGEIRYTDREIGKFLARLEELGVRDDVLLVVTSDHGEGLGDHGELTHGYYAWDTTTHVPLIIHGAPGVKAGTRIGGVTRNYDLAPTLTELMALDALEFGKQAHGVSLVRSMQEPGTDMGLEAYVETHYAWLNANWAKIRGLRTADALTLFAGDEVLHLRDAAQNENSADHHGDAVTAARSEIERLLNSWLPPRGENVQVREASAGSPYPGETPVAQSFEPEKLNDTRNLPSPHVNVDVLRAYQEAELEYDAGRFAVCAQMLRDLTAEHPEFGMAHKLLAAVNQGIVQRDAGRLGQSESRRLIREGAQSLETASAMSRGHGQQLAALAIDRNLALMLAWLDDAEALRKVSERNDDAAIRWMLAVVRYRTAQDEKDRSEAVRRAREVLAAAPEDSAFTGTAGTHLEIMERGEEIRLAPWE